MQYILCKQFKCNLFSTLDTRMHESFGSSLFHNFRCLDVEEGEWGSWEEAEVRLAHFASLMRTRNISSNTFKPQFCLQNTGRPHYSVGERINEFLIMALTFSGPNLDVPSDLKF